MEKSNQERENITIRITGKEITARLSCLEKAVSKLTYANYIELSLILVMLGKTFLF